MSMETISDGWWAHALRMERDGDDVEAIGWADLAGADAFLAGRALDECPDDGSPDMRTAWRRGWKEQSSDNAFKRAWREIKYFWRHVVLLKDD